MDYSGKLGQFFEYLRRPVARRGVAVLALAALALVVMGDYAVIAVLTVATLVLSYVVGSLGLRSTGVELLTFTTVLAGVAFGPVGGAAAGFLLALGQLVVGRFIGVFILWVVPGYAVAGALAGLLSEPVSIVGTGIVIGLHAVFSGFTLYFTPGNFSRYLPYAAGNIAFNLVLFQFAAPAAVGLMA